MRISRRAASVAAVFCVLGSSLAACAGDDVDSVNEQYVSGINPKAELDYDAATVRLPSSYVETNYQENDMFLLDDASSGAYLKCAHEKAGFDMTVGYPVDREEPVRDVFWRYGPWTKEMAEKYAFVPPLTDGEMMFNGFVPRPADWVAPESSGNPFEGVSDQERERIREVCGKDPDALRFLPSTVSSDGPAAVELSGAWDRAERDPRVQGLVDELDQCFRGQGLEAHPRRIGSPTAGDPGVLNEEQIEIALKTVECKDEVDFTQRLADVLAEYEMEIIDGNASELVAARELWDDRVLEARQYIAENPDYFVLPTDE